MRTALFLLLLLSSAMCGWRRSSLCEAARKKQPSTKKRVSPKIAPLNASSADSHTDSYAPPRPVSNDTASPGKSTTPVQYSVINEKSRRVRINDLYTFISRSESSQGYKNAALENRITNFAKSDVLLSVQYLLSLAIVLQCLFERTFPMHLNKIRTNTLFLVIVNRFIDILCRMNNVFGSNSSSDMIGKSNKKQLRHSHVFQSILPKDRSSVARSAREEIRTLIDSSESQNIIYSLITMLFAKKSFPLVSLVVYDIAFVVKYTILAYIAIDNSKSIDLPEVLTNAFFQRGSSKVQQQPSISLESAVDALSIASELGVLASLVLSDRGKSSPMFLLYYALVTQYLIERLRVFLRGDWRDLLGMFDGSAGKAAAPRKKSKAKTSSKPKPIGG